MKILVYILLMFLLPYLIGALVSRYLNKGRDSLALNLSCGYAVIWATTEILVLACYLLSMPLSVLSVLCMALWLILAAASIWRNGKRLVKILQDSFQSFRKGGILSILLFLTVLAQTGFVSYFQHVDDDDAYYVATTETSISTDSIMEYDPYTGNAYNNPPARYLLSPFPIYQAVLAKLTGIAPVILAHTMFPIAMIPLGYFVYWLLASWLWPGEDIQEYQKRYTFLLFTALVLACSGYSVYSQGMFFLIRIWQGKAVLAGILLPMTLYWGLHMQEKELVWMDFVMMSFIMCASCMVSSMGIMLGAILFGMTAFAGFIQHPRIRLLVSLAGCCLPNVVLAAIYVLIR